MLRMTNWRRCHWVWADEEIGNDVTRHGTYGPIREVLAALRKVGARAHLVDIGANVGVVSAAALASGYSVTSIEAESHNAALLNATLHLNSWAAKAALLHGHAVVADANRTPSVHFRRWGKSNRGASRVVKSGGVAIPTISLDANVALPAHAPLVVKIDIEGCEHEALRGAHDLLRRTQYLVTEISPRAIRACHGDPSGYVSWILAQGLTKIEMPRRRAAVSASALRQSIALVDSRAGLLDSVVFRRPKLPPLYP